MKERIFETLPVPKLFLRCVVPSMTGMAFAGLYFIADGIFVGHFIGSEALAAINLVMPVIMIITAIADMIAVGSAVRISILLGRKDHQGASHVFTISLGLAVATTLLLGCISFIFADSVMSLMGASDNTARYAAEYFRLYALFMPLCSIYYSTDNYLRACGKQKLSMLINIICSLLNIVLDAFMIAGLHQGLWAAAFASCISMTIGAIWSMIPFLLKKMPLKLMRGSVPLRHMTLIMTNGSSEFFVSIAGSAMMIIMNMVLLGLGGATAVAAVAIVEYIEGITGMILFSVNEAMHPAVSYCFGANLLERVKKIMKTIAFASLTISVLAMLFLLLGGQYILPFFIQAGDTDLYNMALRAMTFFAFSYPLGWIDGFLSGYLTAIERPLQSLAVSLAGTVFFPGLVLCILVPSNGLDGVWLMPVIAGLFSSVTAIIIAKRPREKRISR